MRHHLSSKTKARRRSPPRHPYGFFSSLVGRGKTTTSTDNLPRLYEDDDLARKNRVNVLSSFSLRCRIVAATICATVTVLGLLHLYLFKASSIAFVHTMGCYRYGLPTIKSTYLPWRWLVPPQFRGRNGSRGSSGFCLCDKHTAAGFVDCEHEPIMCDYVCSAAKRTGAVIASPQKPCDTSLPRPKCAVELQPPSADQMILWRAFLRARGADMTSIFPGVRKEHHDDVTLGKRLSAEEIAYVRSRIDAFTTYFDAPPTPSPGVFRGRGIVIVGGSGQYAVPMWVALHAIKRAKSQLPIEVWIPSSEVPGTCAEKKLLMDLGVTVRTFDEFTKTVPLRHFEYKAVALIFSSFEEALLLDSDNIVVRDPATLFESSTFRGTGAMLWMDFWKGSSSPDCQTLLGAATAMNHTHESGQVLVNKRLVWKSLMLMLFMNSHSSVFYPLSVNYMGLGDKELLAMSMKSLGEPYSLVPFGPDHVGVRTDQGTYGNTMLQYAPDGKVMFLHTNLGKLTTVFPTNRDNYVRRWQTSRVHGSKVRDLIADASGTDLEFWMLDTLESFRCMLDDESYYAWYQTIGFGPFATGMYLEDHKGHNKQLSIWSAQRNAEEEFNL